LPSRRGRRVPAPESSDDLTPEEEARYERCREAVHEFVTSYLTDNSPQGSPPRQFTVDTVLMVDALGEKMLDLLAALAKARLLKTDAPIKIMRRMEKLLMSL
jgi:hypothetical protein